MAIRYIVYDLKNGDTEDYDVIDQAIDDLYEDNIKPFNTTYYISTEESAKDVFRKIKKYFKRPYKLLVGDHGGSFSEIDSEEYDWLKKHNDD